MNINRKAIDNGYFETEYLKMFENINQVIKKEKIMSNLEYTQLMDGFFILFGGINLSSGQICLKMNKDFLAEYLIRAPELIS